MRNILIDSSVWIEYFRGSDKSDNSFIEEIIDTNLVCINDLILSELILFSE
jgi:predicted nucleic acid-binding protein